MSEQQVAGGHGTSDGLWLLGGLAAGGILLGLLIAAYAIGYHRGQHHAAQAAAPTTQAATTTTGGPTTPTTGATIGPVAVTPALVAFIKSQK